MWEGLVTDTVITGTNFRYRALGSYGVIYVDDAACRARKVFNSLDRSRGKAKWVFDGEVDAYRIAMASSELRPFVPEFHGTCVIDGISHDNGDLGPDCLHLDLCYEIEFIPDAEFKKGGSKSPAMYDLERKLQAAGICYTEDMDWFSDAGRIRKVIDFASRAPKEDDQ